MGLKTRRPPKKGASAAKKKDEDTKTEATSETSSMLGLDNLRIDEGPSAADKLSSEGIIATYARVRENSGLSAFLSVACV